MIISATGQEWEMSRIHDDLWHLFDIHAQTKQVKVNVAGLELFMSHLINESNPVPAYPTCLLVGYDMPCPHGWNEQKRPCQHYRKSKRAKAKCVLIVASDYTSELVPVGQMSLFSPKQTHVRSWSSPNFRWKDKRGAIQPMVKVEVCCRDQYMAVLKWLQKTTFSTANKWKIRLPKPDPDWEQEQHEKYELPGCIFDML